MATVIDSLIVELGLDASKFNNEQKKAVESLRKFKDKTKEHVDPVQEGFEGLLKTFGAIQGRLLAIGGIIAAGLGFNRLIQDATRLNSELGYMSKSLGVSAAELSKWEAAGATVGAQANEIASSFGAIQKSMAEMQLTGSSPLNAFAYTTHQKGQGPAVELYDNNGKWRNPTDILVDISRWAEKQENKAVASQMIGKLGMGQGMTNMLLLGPDELKKRLKEQEKFAPDGEDIKKFQQLQEAFGNLVTIIGVLERLLAVRLAPTLTAIINKITEFLRKIGLGENPADVAGDTAAKSGFSELAPNADKPSLAARAWNWLRGKKTSTGTDGSRAQDPNTPLTETEQKLMDMVRPRGGSGAAGGGGDGAGGGASSEVNGSLAEQRQQFAQQLQNNPELKDKMLRIMYNEQGKHPEGTQSIAESMMNRALVRGTSLEKEARWTGEGGYYAQGNMGVGALENPRTRAILERSLDRALAGGNASNYATDNASSWLADKHKATGHFLPTGEDIHGETFFSPDTRINKHFSRWEAWKQRTEATETARKATAPAQLPPWLPGVGGASATGDTAAARSFSNWQNLGVGARGALSSGGSSVSNSSTSSTHIGEMNVSVPAGADPAAYGSGIRQELQRFDNVQNSNTGLR